jgi:soluble lytic murein transglycosylase
MKPTVKRTLIIVIIIAISIAAGLCLDAVWSLLEKKAHPKNYSDIVEKYAAEYDIPPEVIFAVIKTESGFDPNARSSAGALGLMQMMPSTFEWLTGEEHLNEKLADIKLFDPEVNIRYGTYYISYLKNRFFANQTNENIDWDIIFAAYNGGEGNVAKWLCDPECIDENGKLVNIPFSETHSYVSKVNKALNTYKEIYAK